MSAFDDGQTRVAQGDVDLVGEKQRLLRAHAEACSLQLRRDPLVGLALRFIHENPAHPWTVGELARQAARYHVLGVRPSEHRAAGRRQSMPDRWRAS
ncbi:hypothetical protein [Nonomuraea dietziae]|uniref:hypothetical protein n=1 Tax=Nonomuraea dietziae TaxID=65515 RepID=UPI0034293A07